MCSGSWAAAWLETLPAPGPAFEVGLALRGDRLVGAWPFVVKRAWPLHLEPPSDLHTFTGGPVVDPDEDCEPDQACYCHQYELPIPATCIPPLCAKAF